MRLFVGIAIAPETGRALEQFVWELRSVAPRLRWSEPEQWHVTLQFLGETGESRFSCIVQQLHAVVANPVEISLAKPGFFERAKVFHVEVQTANTLLALHRETEAALRSCGIQPEARAYSPHITLARGKAGSSQPEFKRLQQAIEKYSSVAFPSFTAKEFLLYQSFTGQAGSRYEVRERFSLM
jgi:RNA 2',3'-cyclic 3'-phosphodiesterase